MILAVEFVEISKESQGSFQTPHSEEKLVGSRAQTAHAFRLAGMHSWHC
jgi:hypothetical protein